MAKNSKRRRGIVAWPVYSTFALGTLANDTAQVGTLLDLADDCFLVSADLAISVAGYTAGEGPLQVGINSSDMSTTNITEAVDASPSNRGDRIAIERAGRPVRTAGFVPLTASQAALEDGKTVRVRCKFSLANSLDLQAFAINRSGAALTTGAVVKVVGKVYGRWT